jgi:transcriptional regulator with XRE-family HTH domain
MQARLDATLTRRDLAKAVGVVAADVRAWERGDEAPTTAPIEAIAEVCGVSVAALVPPREALSFDPVNGRLVVGGQEVRLDVAVLGNEGVLRSYLSLVRAVRALADDAPVSLRLDDLEVLAIALDVTDAHLEEQLVELAGLSERAAADSRRRLVRRRTPTRLAALAVGVLAAVPVVHLRGQHQSELPPPSSPTLATTAGSEFPVEIGEALVIERDPLQP